MNIRKKSQYGFKGSEVLAVVSTTDPSTFRAIPDPTIQDFQKTIDHPLGH